MQYLLKITILSVPHQVFRLISLDGAREVDHVLDLCSLAFDYDHYDSRSLIFPKSRAGYEALRDFAFPDLRFEDRIGPLTEEPPPFYTACPDAASMEAQNLLERLDLVKLPALRLSRFDSLIAQRLSRICSVGGIEDLHPESSSDRPLFLLLVNDVPHLVEVMESSEKLKCFVPAVIAGRGAVKDQGAGSDDPLSLESVLSQLRSAELGDAPDVLDLRALTGALRALSDSRSQNSVNDMLVSAGASPLSFKSE